MTQQLHTDELFNLDLIHKYDKAGPRYTSYPTAPMFHTGINGTSYAASLARASQVEGPLSIYLHVPFCDTVCYYCGCNKVVTKQRERAVPYVEALLKEIDMLADTVGRKRLVTQLHWGGGTPTFLNESQIRSIMGRLRERFEFASDAEGEFGIEIDPRECKDDTVRILREVGFNRMSMGVQDFEPDVQKAVNRIQSEEETLNVLQQARAHGFQSINIDLMYGLPHQSVESFDRTLSTIIDFSPDRIALFNYAHLPRMFMPQRRINEADLPSPGEKLNILKLSIDRLLSAGYVFIGMDHFAKPDDELTVAQREGKLYRNFQGYSTQADAELLGLGITSIGYVDGAFFQNLKTLEEYYASIEAGEFPVFRGYQLSDEDHLRRHVIMRLMCDFALDFKAVEKKFGIDFAAHFAVETAELHDLAADGLLSLDTNGLQVLPGGRLLIRNIAMVFDEYLRNRKEEVKFSKVI
ncbi:MAG: oxygen-independent coproporphyrinogen III oxidase [Zetaproteobacteria bacterium CG2_30_59_37]|nr:MAG: oxygen-independent coproporphyrinogen III oxidase [Zetaproteobacteria bacterium CG2_30_59_37]